MTTQTPSDSPISYPETSGKPFPRATLSHHVKEFIIQAILKGDYAPGDRIKETILADQLGISTAPVREAIRELLTMGFLEAQPYKGALVRSFSPKDLWEYRTVRASLESLAASEAATRITNADISQLQNILEQMVLAAQDNEIENVIWLDNKFHETIMQITENKLLYRVWKTLEFGVWTMIMYRMGQYDVKFLASRHQEVLAGISTRDPEKAATAMKHHIIDLGTMPEVP